MFDPSSSKRSLNRLRTEYLLQHALLSYMLIRKLIDILFLVNQYSKTFNLWDIYLF